MCHQLYTGLIPSSQPPKPSDHGPHVGICEDTKTQEVICPMLHGSRQHLQDLGPQNLNPNTSSLSCSGVH